MFCGQTCGNKNDYLLFIVRIFTTQVNSLLRTILCNVLWNICLERITKHRDDEWKWRVRAPAALWCRLCGDVHSITYISHHGHVQVRTECLCVSTNAHEYTPLSLSPSLPHPSYAKHEQGEFHGSHIGADNELLLCYCFFGVRVGFFCTHIRVHAHFLAMCGPAFSGAPGQLVLEYFSAVINNSNHHVVHSPPVC